MKSISKSIKDALGTDIINIRQVKTDSFDYIYEYIDNGETMSISETINLSTTSVKSFNVIGEFTRWILSNASHTNVRVANMENDISKRKTINTVIESLVNKFDKISKHGVFVMTSYKIICFLNNDEINRYRNFHTNKNFDFIVNNDIDTIVVGAKNKAIFLYKKDMKKCKLYFPEDSKLYFRNINVSVVDTSNTNRYEIYRKIWE